MMIEQTVGLPTSSLPLADVCSQKTLPAFSFDFKITSEETQAYHGEFALEVRAVFYS